MKIELQRGAMPIELDRPRTIFFDMAGTWLLVQRYDIDFMRELYLVERTDGKTSDLRLKSQDALGYFLWAGLQAELADTEETLTLEQAKALIRPWTLREIFEAMVKALTGATHTPALPGKEAAAGAAAKPVREFPAVPRSPRGSTTQKRKGSSAGS